VQLQKNVFSTPRIHAFEKIPTVFEGNSSTKHTAIRFVENGPLV